MISTLQIWCCGWLGVVVRGASCGGRRGIGVQKDKHPNALYSRLQGAIWGHGSAGLSVGHAACRLLSLTKHMEAWCVVRGWDLMPGDDKTALGTGQCVVCRGESLKPDFYINLCYRVWDLVLWQQSLTQTRCNKNWRRKKKNILNKEQVHGHIGSNQINQNVEPKTFFKGEVMLSFRNKTMLSIQEKELWIFDTSTTIWTKYY